MSFNFPWRKKETSIKEGAYRWVVREDSGLSPAEQEELTARMSTDPEFAKAIEKSKTAWQLLDNLSPDLAFESRSDKQAKPLLLQPIWRNLSIAAVFLIGLFVVLQLGIRKEQNSVLYYTETRSTFDPWTQRLPDGSIVRLNADTKVTVKFTPEFRQVKLLRGEAHFTVAKNPKRPFRVFVHDVKVQAVGTAFNVRLESNKVDVLVTEGTVELAPNQTETTPATGTSALYSHHSNQHRNLVTSGQRAEVLFQPESQEQGFDIAIVDSQGIEETLAWQKALLTLGGDSFEVIAADFEQKTGVKLIIADPELNSLRIGGRFPSEDVRGFLQVLKSGYGIQWSEKSDGTLVVGESL